MRRVLSFIPVLALSFLALAVAFIASSPESVQAAPPAQTIPTTGWTLSVTQEPANPVLGQGVTYYVGISRAQSLSYDVCVLLYNTPGYPARSYHNDQGWTTFTAGTTSIANTDTSRRMRSRRLSYQTAFGTSRTSNFYVIFALPNQLPGDTCPSNTRIGYIGLESGSYITAGNPGQVSYTTTWVDYTQTNADWDLIGAPPSQRAGFPINVVATVYNKDAAGFAYCYIARFTDTETSQLLGYGTDINAHRAVSGNSTSFTLANLIETPQTGQSSKTRSIEAEVFRSRLPIRQGLCPAAATVYSGSRLSLGTHTVGLSWSLDTATAHEELTLTRDPVGRVETGTRVEYTATVLSSAASGLKHCYYVDQYNSQFNSLVNSTVGVVIQGGMSHAFTITEAASYEPRSIRYRFVVRRLQAEVSASLSNGDRCDKFATGGYDNTGAQSVELSWLPPLPTPVAGSIHTCPPAPCFVNASNAPQAITFAREPIIIEPQETANTYKITVRWLEYTPPPPSGWDGLIARSYHVRVYGGGDVNAGVGAMTFHSGGTTLVFTYTSDPNTSDFTTPGSREFVVWMRATAGNDGYPIGVNVGDITNVPAGGFIYTSPSKLSFVLPRPNTAAVIDTSHVSGAALDEVNAAERLAELENVRPGFEGIGAKAALEIGQLTVDTFGLYQADASRTNTEQSIDYLTQAKQTALAMYLVGLFGIASLVTWAGTRKRASALSPLGGACFGLIFMPGWFLGWLYLDLYGWAMTGGLLVAVLLIGAVIGVSRYRSGL